jgi:hypothetical protein
MCVHCLRHFFPPAPLPQDWLLMCLGPQVANDKMNYKMCNLGWECGSVVGHLPSIREALVSIPNTTKKNEQTNK